MTQIARLVERIREVRYLQALQRAKRVHRDEYLVDMARGRRVLHIGCVDHGLLDDRLEKGSLLHSKLAVAAKELWGLDVNEEGVHRLRSAGFSHLWVGSAETPPREIPERYFEVVIAGELIEHLRNPGLFLDASVRLLEPEGVLVVTTPNAMRFYNPIAALVCRELAHPDHLSWYSPYTLRNALAASPYSIEDLCVYDSVPLARLKDTGSLWNWSARMAYNAVVATLHAPLVRLFPYLADGLIIVGRPSLRT